MISRDEFIAAAVYRATHWVEDHPPTDGPTLGEAEEATKAGRPSRYRGDVCKGGHQSPERYANGQCKACDRERQREWRARG